MLPLKIFFHYFCTLFIIDWLLSLLLYITGESFYIKIKRCNHPCSWPKCSSAFLEMWWTGVFRFKSYMVTKFRPFTTNLQSLIFKFLLCLRDIFMLEKNILIFYPQKIIFIWRISQTSLSLNSPHSDCKNYKQIIYFGV